MTPLSSLTEGSRKLTVNLAVLGFLPALRSNKGWQSRLGGCRAITRGQSCPSVRARLCAPAEPQSHESVPRAGATLLRDVHGSSPECLLSSRELSRRNKATRCQGEMIQSAELACCGMISARKLPVMRTFGVGKVPACPQGWEWWHSTDK